MKRFSCLTAFSGLILLLGGAGSEQIPLSQSVFCMLGGLLLLMLAERLYTVRTARLARRLRKARRTVLRRIRSGLCRSASAFDKGHTADRECVRRLPKKANC